ncbi:MAG: hypothetical protein NWF05_09385 [Candidatus Bathyarchaeota archaeon]|nr:hypothetical protein [Candidatus Bathyarchaeota archaeon]
MTAERVIHAAVFVLLLVGLCTVTGWASYQYIQELVLKVAGITLSWGITLLILYVAFKKKEWHWWG